MFYDVIRKIYSWQFALRALRKSPKMAKRKPTVPKPQRISIGLSESEYAELWNISERHEVSLAWLGRQALLEFLERYRDEHAQLPLKLARK
jgi:hypothetical protein